MEFKKRVAEMVREFTRRVSIYSGEEPTMQELELVAEAKKRIKLVIEARWGIIILLTIYGAITLLLYSATLTWAELARRLTVPIIALLVVVAYNAWYHYSYELFAHIKGLNQAQIILDIIVATVLIHYSGGIHSWFWVMYILFTLEAAILLDRRIDTWLVGSFGAFLYGGLLLAEYSGLIKPVSMPFVSKDLHGNLAYNVLHWYWVLFINAAVAFVGTYLMDVIRKREAALKRAVITDSLTGLYNRTYFYRALRSEVERGKRYDRIVSLLMIDIDNFKDFNDTFGHVEGDKLLQAIAQILKRNIRRSDTEPAYDIDVPCRYGGEEFVVILPETPSTGGVKVAERLRRKVQADAAIMVAERIRLEIEKTKVKRRGVTVSIGVATFPVHALTVDEFIKVADAAMYAAKQRGKNRVFLWEKSRPKPVQA